MANLNQTIQQGLRYPYRFIRGRFSRVMTTADQLKPGEGAIIEENGKKVAAYKDASGKITTLSPVCKHLACMVDWNAGEKTWDCPCHGSRYAADGTVIHGPSTKNLDRLP